MKTPCLSILLIAMLVALTSHAVALPQSQSDTAADISDSAPDIGDSAADTGKPDDDIGHSAAESDIVLDLTRLFLRNGSQFAVRLAKHGDKYYKVRLTREGCSAFDQDDKDSVKGKRQPGPKYQNGDHSSSFSSHTANWGTCIIPAVKESDLAPVPLNDLENDDFLAMQSKQTFTWNNQDYYCMKLRNNEWRAYKVGKDDELIPQVGRPTCSVKFQNNNFEVIAEAQSP